MWILGLKGLNVQLQFHPHCPPFEGILCGSDGVSNDCVCIKMPQSNMFAVRMQLCSVLLFTS